MAYPEIAFCNAARHRLLSGAEHLAACVRPTFGPVGGSVLVERAYAVPASSRDGSFLSRRLECRDHVANLGLKAVRDAARMTHDEAGDGTTTAMILAGAILSCGWASLAAGIDPRALRSGLVSAWREADAEIGNIARPLDDDGRALARRAAGDRDLGDIVMRACDRAGKAGIVRVESDPGTGARIDLWSGMAFPSRLLSEAFLTDAARGRAELEDAFVLLHEEPLASLDPLVPILEKVLDAGRPLVVISEDVAEEALTSLALNARKGGLKCLAVRAPGFGKRRRGFFEDVACLTGANFMAREKGDSLAACGLSHLGFAARVSASPERVTIAGGGGGNDALRRHVARLEHETETEDSPFDREQLLVRKARLAGSTAVIHVGGVTEADAAERRSRTRNAVCALSAARESGVMTGGGADLMRAAPRRPEAVSAGVVAGYECLSRALCEPLRVLAANSGHDAGVILEALSADRCAGWDAVSGRVGRDVGVVDAVSVMRTALCAAVGVAGSLLETGAVVARLPHPEETVFI